MLCLKDRDYLLNWFLKMITLEIQWYLDSSRVRNLTCLLSALVILLFDYSNLVMIWNNALLLRMYFGITSMFAPTIEKQNSWSIYGQYLW